jgi:hypothetical protein
MPRIKRPTVSAEEVGMMCEHAESAVYALGCVAPDSDGHTAALVLQEWLELLYVEVARRAESQVAGQLRLM